MPDKAQLAQHRGETVLALSTFACTRHPRVRAAAFYSISHLFAFHGRDLPARLSEQLLEVVLSGLPAVNNPAPRVRRKGTSAWTPTLAPTSRHTNCPLPPRLSGTSAWNRGAPPTPGSAI